MHLNSRIWFCFGCQPLGDATSGLLDSLKHLRSSATHVVPSLRIRWHASVLLERSSQTLHHKVRMLSDASQRFVPTDSSETEWYPDTDSNRNQEFWRLVCYHYTIGKQSQIGETTGTRTLNLLVKSQLLYH